VNDDRGGVAGISETFDDRSAERELVVQRLHRDQRPHVPGLRVARSRDDAALDARRQQWLCGGREPARRDRRMGRNEPARSDVRRAQSRFAISSRRLETGCAYGE
jgi:hypothetical protein